MNEDIKKDTDSLISAANEAVEKLSHEFISTLKERVGLLEASILDNNQKKAVTIAYDLESEAALFGWPRVTRLCKWLRKVLKGNYDQKPSAEDVLKVLNALKLMVFDSANPNEDRDMNLIKELYPLLKKTISDI